MATDQQLLTALPRQPLPGRPGERRRPEPDDEIRFAQAGVDLLSVGWLTHSASVLDIGLDHVA